MVEADGTRFDLEDRLLDYAANIVHLTRKMDQDRAGNHVAGQLLRSGTSPLFNHGEAQGAESQKDFVHKLGICLKELKESKRALRLTHRVPLINPPSEVDPLLQETEELIRIFGASIRTAKKNLVKEGNEDGYSADGGEKRETHNSQRET